MNLIIQAYLTDHSDSLAFWHVTQSVKTDFNMDILLLSEQMLKDLYWKFLLKRGIFDYIDYILTPEEKEDGIRLDDDYRIPPTIKIKGIKFENQRKILKMIKDFEKMC
ncbi:MAG: hypothetical protein AABY22_08215 [Nanoarchaeota archaeon]